MRFALNVPPLTGPLLAIFGFVRGRPFVELDESDLWVNAGWVYRARIPRRSIRRAERRPSVTKGDEPSAIVDIFADPPASVRILGFPQRLGHVQLWLVDPDGFLRAVNG